MLNWYCDKPLSEEICLKFYIPTVQDAARIHSVLWMGFLLFPALVAALESPDTSFQRYLVVPFGAYTEETGGQIGFLGMLFARPSQPDEPGDMFTASGVLTTEGQKIFLVGSNGSAVRGKVRGNAFLQYSDWPGKYWAGGNEPSGREWSYSMSSFRLNGSVYVSPSLLSIVPDSLGKHLRGGVLFDLEKNTTRFSGAGDSMASVRGMRSGGRRIGFGPTLQWDTRDDQGWPTRGVFLTAGQLYDRREWGSDWSFTKSSLDLRGYASLPWSAVLAVGTLWEETHGQVPFDKLAMPDGSNRLRGLAKGRLRDAQQLVLQSELRFPSLWRFSAVTFAEAGKVGADLEELGSNEFHYSFGAGLRFSVNPQRKLNFRTDVAWVDGAVGVTASFGEAF